MKVRKAKISVVIAAAAAPLWGQFPWVGNPSTLAQSVPLRPVRPGDPNPPLNDSPPQPTAPPSPILTPPSTQPTPEQKSSPPLSPLLETTSPTETHFFIRQIDVLGSTVLIQEIAHEVKAYENQTLTLDQLLELRSKITQLYIDNGYLTSGAFFPNNQNLSNGVAQIQVVEGELEEIQITGLKRLRKSYVRDRINRGTKTPLNQKSLEKSLQLLQLNPLIKRIDAELTAGSTPGLSTLLVDVEQTRSFHAGVAFDNYRNPSSGSLQGSLEVSHDNVLGFGDRFSGEYNITEGLNLYDLNYTFPINALDGTLGVRYSNVESNIIDEDFNELGLRSEFETLSFNIRQPIIKAPKTEFALGLTFDSRQSQSFLFDTEPFSTTLGPDDGESKVRVLRFSQNWVNRQPTRVLAFQSQFNFGLNIFDATVNEIGPSAEFFSWLGQAQLVQKLPLRALLITRLSAQLTPDSLLSLEKIGIGGINTTRGYVQNQILTDNGILGSLEVQFPLTSDPSILQISPFIDVGTGWNNFEQNPTPSTLLGLGLGLRWQPHTDLSLRLDYGIPLLDVETRGNSLQESGAYFSLQYQPF